MEFILSNLANILIFAAVMSIIVLVHEWGHLMAAKFFGVYCKEFAIGMGPVLVRHQSKRSETAYSLRALPIGGFVSMAGESGEMGMEHVPFHKTISGIARWKRLVIFVAGVFMNVVLAFVVFAAIFTFNGVSREPLPIIHKVVEGYPAFEAGLQDGDEIVRMTFYDGTVVTPESFGDASLAINSFKDNPITFEVLRNGKVETIVVTPIHNEDSNTYIIGVQSPQGVVEKVGVFETISYTSSFIVTSMARIIQILGWMFKGVGLHNVGGPLAIYQETSNVMTHGMLYFWYLIGSLSLSLSVMNLIPIPVFDGGRIVLTLVEMVIRRPIPKKLENFVMILGFFLVLILLLFFVFNDLKRF